MDASLPIGLLNGEPEHSESMRGREGVSDVELEGDLAGGRSDEGGFLDPHMPLNVETADF